MHFFKKNDYWADCLMIRIRTFFLSRTLIVVIILARSLIPPAKKWNTLEYINDNSLIRKQQIRKEDSRITHHQKYLFSLLHYFLQEVNEYWSFIFDGTPPSVSNSTSHSKSHTNFIRFFFNLVPQHKDNLPCIFSLTFPK